jgi:acetone carboxylase gamma subunit
MDIFNDTWNTKYNLVDNNIDWNSRDRMTKKEKKHDRTTRGIKNCRDSRLFKGCSPLQLLCSLTGNRPQSATFHTAVR